MEKLVKAPGENSLENLLDRVLEYIMECLDTRPVGDPIQQCGKAPLTIIHTRPDDVLELATRKMHAWPYHQVPLCWRRLYEDASLSKAEHLLKRLKGNWSRVALGEKRKRADSERETSSVFHDAEAIPEVVRALDMGIHLSGAPGRAHAFEEIFQRLEKLLHAEEGPDSSSHFEIQHQKRLDTDCPIERAAGPLELEDFQTHLDRGGSPVIIPNALQQWPASELWQDPKYWLRRTLNGERLIPVEIGKSYTEEDWSQTLIPFRDFTTSYLLPAIPKDIGYLAQHDLFAQIPSLKSDILTPDYCYTSPPTASGPAAKTSGLATTRTLDEPMLNAWFGPRGTKTPLHTDPYHNILCQVVGYKYVRLYAPEQTARLYPRGVDEKGISMENTSQVDLDVSSGAAEAMAKIDRQFPLFREAQYVEAILAPGECLYIPLGWWHFVESRSTSFSVSFWWN